jgi:hypothetical protein
MPEVAHDEDWAEVERVLLAHTYKPDLVAPRALYASYAAHRLPGNAVWLMVVGPPASGKSEMLSAIDGLRDVHSIDSFTSKAFLSGRVDDPANPMATKPSLLHRIGESGIILAKDFSTVLSAKHEVRETVFSDLRKIYDGELSKEFGTGEDPNKHKWKGRITFLAGVTPEIDKHSATVQSLGERFILVRIPRADGPDAAMVAMNQNTVDMRRDLKHVVSRLLENLPTYNPAIPKSLQRKIACLGEIVACARATITRGGDRGKEITDEPQIESSTRISQQLAQLGRGSALLSHRQEVNDFDYRLVQRVGLDCIRPTRRQLLEAVLRGRNLAELKMNPSTRKYALEDLEAVGLIVDKAAQSVLTPNALKWAIEAGFRDPVN